MKLSCELMLCYVVAVETTTTTITAISCFLLAYQKTDAEVTKLHQPAQSENLGREAATLYRLN